ncbi:MAG: hypothetical protein EA389_00985 [Ilumatobacter sp.]|jgi:septation ring formation regulator EzrA|nr:MAG: hypothetical protein EA389_00985 [Ilumatobacter sp.]
MAIVVIVVVVVVVAAAIVLLIRRREPNTFDSFQRQIDALSPEARRPVVEQVNQAGDTETGDTETGDTETGDTETGDTPAVEEEPDDGPDELEDRPDGT